MKHIYVLDDSTHHSIKGKLLFEKYSVSNYTYISNIEKLNNVENCIIVLPFCCEKNDHFTEKLNQLSNNNLILAASGNDGEGASIPYPANLNAVLSVGSHDYRHMISLFNNTHKSTSDVYSLGKHVLSGMECAGTSLACIHAAIILKDIKISEKAIPKMYIKKYHVEDRCAWKIEKGHYKNRVASRVISQKLEKVNPISLKITDIHHIEYDEQNQISNVMLHYKEYDKKISLKKHLLNILSDIPNNIAIPMSGGIDSEVLANLLLELNKPFSPIIMRYTIDDQHMNEHDFYYAEMFCRQNKIKPSYLDLNIVKFFDSEMHLEYATKYFCTSPQHACHLWMLEQINDAYVMTGDIPYYNEQLACSPISYYSYDYFNQHNNIDGYTRLFWHDTKSIHNLTKLYNKYRRLGDYQRKTNIYRDCGFIFNYIPKRKKYTGFEKIKQWYDDKYGGIRVFDSFYRKPMKNRVNDRLDFYYDPKYDYFN